MALRIISPRMLGRVARRSAVAAPIRSSLIANKSLKSLIAPSSHERGKSAWDQRFTCIALTVYDSCFT